MAELVFTTDAEEPLRAVFEALRPYLKSMAFERIVVRANCKTRFIMNKECNGYKVFGQVVTNEMIQRTCSNCRCKF